MSEARWMARTGVAPAADAAAPSTPASIDPRVQMVLDVLAGASVDSVAATWNVDATLVKRWLGDFLAAGAAVVANEPEDDVAKQRDRFMAAFAHELRTPVAVAQGWAMALADGDVPPSQMEKSYDTLCAALARLSDQITDIELSTAASLGRLRLHQEQVTVDQVRTRVAGVPPARSGGDLAVHADPDLLARILRDLWTTASRDPEPASVGIEVIEEGLWHEIRVIRRGQPLSERLMQILMDPFGPDNDDTTGVTTGLYPARALAVAHGGLIGAEGDAETTVLLVRLPRPSSDPRTTPGPVRPTHEKDGTP